MENWGVVVGAAALAILGLGVMGIFWARLQKRAMAAQAEFLAASLESLQRNLNETTRERLQQAESLQEVRNSTLRTELSQALEQNRKELHAGLRSASETLETRVRQMDDR